MNTHFYRDLDRFNAKFRKLGAVVTHPDGFMSIDTSKAPAGLLRPYRLLVQYGYANGLL